MSHSPGKKLLLATVTVNPGVKLYRVTGYSEGWLRERARRRTVSFNSEVGFDEGGQEIPGVDRDG